MSKIKKKSFYAKLIFHRKKKKDESKIYENKWKEGCNLRHCKVFKKKKKNKKKEKKGNFIFLECNLVNKDFLRTFRRKDLNF